MKTNQRNFHGQILAVLATVLTALVITACGGGGGSSGTITTPATGAVTKAVSCTIQANAASCGASVEYTTSGASAPKLVVGTTTMATSASGSLSVTIGNVTVPVTLYDNATVLDSSKSVTGTCASGTSWNGSACAPVVASWWPPTTVKELNQWASNPKAPPLENNYSPAVGGAVWQQAVKDGTIQFLKTGMKLIGFSSEDLYVAFFIDPFLNNVCTTLVYKSNGSSVYSNPLTYGGCKTSPFDKLMGTGDGFIMHASVTGKCYKETWIASSQSFQESEVACPQ
jgi:predicted lipoprotein with Yx(FWY)xxD motif